MKSLIDQIYYIEDHVSEIRKQSEQEILHIHNETKDKVKQMQDSYAEDFIKESQALEEQMINRVSEYDGEIHQKMHHPKEFLMQVYQSKKEQILEQAVEFFWKG